MRENLTGRVLVTGASGFVGRQALAPLADRGFEVHGVVSRPTSTLPNGVVRHEVDLLAADEPERLVAEIAPSHLVHLAWTTAPGSYWTSADNLRWVTASLALLDAFGRGGGRRFVGVGTCAEYDWNAGDLEEGETPDGPSTIYGRTKLALAHLAAASADLHGFSSVWGRLFFLFGPHEHPARLVPTVARALLAGEPAEVTEGRQERDFMSSEDAGAALAALAVSDVTGVVNVASGHAVPVREVVSRVARLVGRDDLVRWGARAGDAGAPKRIATTARRLRREVGFEPAFDLEAGLRRAVDFWRGP